jgi:hypothetical protein
MLPRFVVYGEDLLMLTEQIKPQPFRAVSEADMNGLILKPRVSSKERGVYY